MDVHVLIIIFLFITEFIDTAKIQGKKKKDVETHTVLHWFGSVTPIKRISPSGLAILLFSKKECLVVEEEKTRKYQYILSSSL
jgi:hypothetical protein